MAVLSPEIQSSPHTSYFVADSALYTAGTLMEIQPQMKWITRVHEKFKSASELICDVEKENMDELSNGCNGIKVCLPPLF